MKKGDRAICHRDFFQDEQASEGNEGVYELYMTEIDKRRLRSIGENIKDKIGQATKGARGMPWHQEPKKDATNCDKPRGAVSRRYIRGFPNGAIRPESCLVIIY